MTNNISELVKNALESIKGMVDVSTVVGDAVKAPDGSMIIPVTQVSCGFGAGGSDIPSKHDSKNDIYPFGGGSGGGVKIKPIAFLIISGEKVKILPVETGGTPIDKILDLVPEMVDKINNIISGYVKKGNSEENSDNDEK